MQARVTAGADDKGGGHMREAIETLAADFGKAFTNRDIDAVVSFYTDDCKVLAPNAPRVDGKSAMREVLRQTEGSRVAVGMENHGAQGNDPEFLTGVLQAIPDPRLGLTLDTGNFYWSGQPLSELYRIYARFAPRVRHTHVKSIAYPAAERERRRETGWKYGEHASPLADGDIDLARVIQLSV